MKLVLFDIDGTLLYHTGLMHGTSKRKMGWRYKDAIKSVFGVDCEFNPEKYNGAVDRQILWELVKDQGIARSQFEKNFLHLVHIMHDLVIVEDKENTQLFTLIEDAKQLVARLSLQKNVCLGVLTGNVESIAWWKLDYVGLKKYFSFGLFGEEADDRVALAKKVFVKADAFFHHQFEPKEITIIGDTVFDIRCGKAIGAKTIGVMTGLHKVTNMNGIGYREMFEQEHADLIVDSLMEKQVLDYFGLG